MPSIGGHGGSSSHTPQALITLSDVAISEPITNGSVITYNATIGKWIQTTSVPSSDGSLATLTDVEILLPIDDGSTLIYNATAGKWVQNISSPVGGITSTTFTQPVASTDWTINGTWPVVVTYDNDGNTIYGTPNISSGTTTVIHFTSAVAGIAYCFGAF